MSFTLLYRRVYIYKKTCLRSKEDSKGKEYVLAPSVRALILQRGIRVDRDGERILLSQRKKVGKLQGNALDLKLHLLQP